MGTNNMEAALLQKMFLAAAARLNAKKEWINELNVFPVPDGDTGTNMTMTIMSAADEVKKLSDVSIESLAKTISSGTLRGARGNSGVILSQLCRGFTREIADHGKINKPVLAAACQRAVETAYKAVMKPKEGTILTVAKGVADKAMEICKSDCSIPEMIAQVIEHGDYVLSKTPDMLPVLKQAGVVDSGGQGLMEVIKGAYDALVGNSVDYEIIEPTAEGGAAASFSVSSENIDTSNIKFGYCTEFIILLEKQFTDDDELEFKKFLMSIGDSLVCVPDDEIVKIHVHTNDPGLAIQRALTYGQLTKLKIDNMRLEHQEKLFNEAQKAEAAKEEEKLRSEVADSSADVSVESADMGERKPAGFVTVSMGEGLDEIFKSLGVDYIIPGGQTNNPSTEDMLNAIAKVNADTIYIFPNNGNIILAANQAKELTEDKEIAVVPSKTVPQGIAALIEFIDGKSTEDNLERMKEAMANVKSGSVTYAVRDTVIDDKEIKENDIMGIGDAGIISVGRDIKDTTLDMISALVDDDSELISIYYGEDIDEDAANALADAISEKYPNVDVEVNPGGQPIYYYLVSVE